MLDRSPQANLFDPGHSGQPAHTNDAPQAAPGRPFDTPPPRRAPRRRSSAPSPGRYLTAASAAIAPVLAGWVRPPRRLRLLAPAAILLLLAVLNPAGCGSDTTTRVVTQPAGGQKPQPRVITRFVTRTVTVRQPAPAPVQPRPAAGEPAHTPAAQPAVTQPPGVTEATKPAAVTPPPSTATVVAPTTTGRAFTDSPPEPSRGESGDEFGFER